MVPPFVPGLELSRLLYWEGVRPLLDAGWPGLAHSAARLGAGSEVLGYDSPRSADHDWGPRVELFLRADDVARHGAGIAAALSERLPKRVRGYPTHFVAGAAGVAHPRPTDGPVRHLVAVGDLGRWLHERLGFDPRDGVSLLDWLATPAQRLAETVGGAVFHDGLAALGTVRARLAWYPQDVWRYVLACQWTRIAQEEAFVGRAGEAGDALGSAVLAARLARDLMRLALLQHRRYPPYGKWLGTAFGKLPAPDGLAAELGEALRAVSWSARQEHLCRALEAAADRQNRLGLGATREPICRPFHERPYPVIGGDRFAAALREGIADARVRRLPLVGAVDQFADSTDVLMDPVRARALTAALLALDG